MRIDAYNQVAQLYGIQKNLKTQKAQNAAGPRDQVSISQAGRDYQVAKSAVSEASDIREDKEENQMSFVKGIQHVRLKRSRI